PAESGYPVLHRAEAPTLLARAGDGARLAGQRLPREPGNDHSVPARLARPDGVEDTDDDGPQAALAAVRVDKALVDGLGLGVAPPRFQRRADNAVVVLAQPWLGVLAGDIAGRSGEQDRAPPGRRRRAVLHAGDCGYQG